MSSESEQIVSNTLVQSSQELKKTLLFALDWSEVFCAAPQAVSSIGSCYVSSRSADSEIDLPKPSSGFVYLKSNQLYTSLVQVAETGIAFFILAEKQMGFVADHCRTIGQEANEILEAIPHLPSPAVLPDLVSKSEFLKKSCGECHESLSQIVFSISKWLDLICELQQAAVAGDEGSGESRLVEQIRFLEHLKGQAALLRRLFDAKLSIVELTRNHIADFLQKLGDQTPLTGPEKSFPLFRTRQMTMTVIMIRSHFLLMGEIASIYTNISIDFLMPAIGFCNQLSVSRAMPQKELETGMRKEQVLLTEQTDVALARIKERLHDKKEKLIAQIAKGEDIE